ncbi:MAG: AbiJ-NTD4 domain-containing protein [Methylosarcina sp.]
MLTDIFSFRYLNHPIWQSYTEFEQRLLIQAFGIIKEFLPYYDDQGKEIDSQKAKWKGLHDQLARELGIDELSRRYYSFTQKNILGQEFLSQGFWGWDYVCEQFVKSPCPMDHSDPDRYIKERISFIELAFRLRNNEITRINERFQNDLIKATIKDKELSRGMHISGSAADGLRSMNTTLNQTFARQVDELNERLRRSRAPLSYHNGFIQVSTDALIEKNISKPFWDVVADPLWTNVDIDMKEALDRRDSNDKDPALFAAKALESAIKIVSKKKGWTRGTESGASNYIDNLVSKGNGSFIAEWEGEMLRNYFKKVRNPLGHGPGSDPMPTLTIAQTDWAIEFAMSWVRALVRRM